MGPGRRCRSIARQPVTDSEEFLKDAVGCRLGGFGGREIAGLDGVEKIVDGLLGVLGDDDVVTFPSVRDLRFNE